MQNTLKYTVASSPADGCSTTILDTAAVIRAQMWQDMSTQRACVDLIKYPDALKKLLDYEGG